MKTHLYLRARGEAEAILSRELPKLGEVVQSGRGTAADASACWFELQIHGTCTTPSFRQRLAEHGLSDHVVRVDRLEERGHGAAQSRQTELFQGGPTAPVAPESKVRAPRRRSDAHLQKGWSW